MKMHFCRKIKKRIPHKSAPSDSCQWKYALTVSFTLFVFTVINTVSVSSEVFGESSNDPATTTFEDDDDDNNPDGELNSSASGEDPDGEGAENYLDEAYEEPEGAWADAESRKRPQFVATLRPRKKRDLDDRQILASRLAEIRRRKLQGGGSKDADDLDNVDDGDEDAWVHDGVDSIQIDPETKRAASEMSYDEKSIEADYDPHREDPPRNRTRITTISEVIPMTSNLHQVGSDADADYDDAMDEAGTRVIGEAPCGKRRNKKRRSYLPAAHLSFEQAERLASEAKLTRPLDSQQTDSIPYWQFPKRPNAVNNQANEPQMVVVL